MATAEIICNLLVSNPDVEPEQISVICMYNAQIQELELRVPQAMAACALRHKLPESQIPDVSKVCHYTVDSSQGREIGISILNFGASGINDVTEYIDTTRFEDWDGKPRLTLFVYESSRLNVATSRQKYALIMVGHYKGLLQAMMKYRNAPKLRELLELCRSKGWIYSAPEGRFLDQDNPRIQKLEELKRRVISRMDQAKKDINEAELNRVGKSTGDSGEGPSRGGNRGGREGRGGGG